MNNNIIAPRIYGNIDFIDPLLPFSNQEVYITHVENRFLGRGHYRLSVHVCVNNSIAELSTTTTNTRLTDEWYDEDGELVIDSIHKAIELVLQDNQHELEELLNVTP